MKTLLERYLPLRAPDDGGAPSAPGASAPAPGTQPPAAGSPAATPPPVAPPPAAGPYRPEGLPDTMYGQDDRATMDNMAKALAGYRQRDSSVPADPSAYQKFDLTAAPEAVRPYLDQLSKDPLYASVAKVAMDEKVPLGTMQKLTQSLYQSAAEAGLLEPMVDVAAERAQLLPESAKGMPQAEQDKAINARLQANEDFVKLFTQPGADGKPALDPKVAEHGLMMLLDTAAGNQFLEFFKGQMTGEGRAQPFGGNQAGAGQHGAREALRAKMAAPEMNPQHPKFDRAAYEALDAEYKKMFGG